MRPYGVPRVHELEYPALADIHALGLASRAGRMKSRSRRAARRYWARCYRRAVAEALRGVEPRFNGRRCGVTADNDSE